MASDLPFTSQTIARTPPPPPRLRRHCVVSERGLSDRCFPDLQRRLRKGGGVGGGIVRTVPLDVGRAFESVASMSAVQSGRPRCTCTPTVLPVWQSAGTGQSL